MSIELTNWQNDERTKILSFRHFVILSLLLFLLSACGFEPVHGKQFQQSLSANLASVAIETDTSRVGQLLNAELEDQVNPGMSSAGVPKQYRIDISISEAELGQFINPDGTSSRGDIQFTSSYTVTRLSDNVAIDSGGFQRISSYNTSENVDYAAYVAREDARKRAVTELARDYMLRLSNLLPKLNDPNATLAQDPAPTDENPALTLPSLQRYEAQQPRN
jgi:hypothetical protein